MALENLEPATRIEEILDGGDITPATRLEYFLSAAANEVPKPEGVSDAGKIPVVDENGEGYQLENIPSELPDTPTYSGMASVLSYPATSLTDTPAIHWDAIYQRLDIPLEGAQYLFTALTAAITAAETAGLGVATFYQPASISATDGDAALQLLMSIQKFAEEDSGIGIIGGLQLPGMLANLAKRNVNSGTLYYFQPYYDAGLGALYDIRGSFSVSESGTTYTYSCDMIVTKLPTS